jgi:hypothetical protein
MQISKSLTLDSRLLRPLLRIPLALLIQILPLLVCRHAAELGVALLLLELVGSQLALFGLLVVVELADLGDLLLAGGLDAAQGFGAEVRFRDEEVGEADEVLEKRESGVVGGTGGLELHGEVDALAGDGVVESGVLLAVDANTVG